MQLSGGRGHRLPISVGVRVITLLYGIRLSSVCSFVSSQNTRVSDSQTDRIAITKTALACLRRAVKKKKGMWYSVFLYCHSYDTANICDCESVVCIVKDSRLCSLCV